MLMILEGCKGVWKGVYLLMVLGDCKERAVGCKVSVKSLLVMNRGCKRSSDGCKEVFDGH